MHFVFARASCRVALSVGLSFGLANLSFAQSTSVSPDPDVKVRVNPYAVFNTSSLWKKMPIPVCWENGSPANATERGWVKDAITKTWEASAAVSFSGWAACTADAKGVRIQIADVRPVTQALGTYIDARPNGMTLNLSFVKSSPELRERKEHWIRFNAVHEFGHALGLDHEQNHPDNPGDCLRDPKIMSDWVATPYDRQSIMRYCSPRMFLEWSLSDGDKKGIIAAYGARKP